MSETRNAILSVARARAQAHGYGGLNFRDLAAEVGIKSASIHYHFPTKECLGAAVAKQYWQDSAAELEELKAVSKNPADCLRRYPEVFRKALVNENRMCLCGFMAAEYDDLPDTVKAEMKAFADVHVTWLTEALVASDPSMDQEKATTQARAIFAAIGGAQLTARGRADVFIFDNIVVGYRAVGLIPN